MSKFKLLSVAIISTALFGFTSSAVAIPKQNTFEENLASLDFETNIESQKVFKNLGPYEPTNSKEYSIVKSPDWMVEAPLHVREPIRISNRHGLFTVSITQNTQYSGHFDLKRGPRAYEYSDGSSISPLVKKDGSVQFVSYIPNEEASHSFTYSLKLPRTMHLNLDPDSNLIYINNDQGDYVGGLAPAWATDANGKSVKTHYQMVGNDVIQVVDKTQLDIAYPVIADPWLGFDLIFRSFWAAALSPPNAYAPTLAVYPTDWGRTVAGATTFPLGGPVLTTLDSLSVRAAWDETLQKTSRSGYPNPNTSSMYHQFECHFFYVSKWDPNKDSWNLDIKRRDANLFDQARSRCNVQ